MKRRNFDYFVTLAFNDVGVNISRARRCLNVWDAKVNRKLIGPKWAKKPDERMLWVFVLEKPQTNIHWHGLIRINDGLKTPFRTVAADRWKNLVRSGTSDVQAIRSMEGLAGYVAKQVNYELCYINLEVCTGLRN